MPRLSEKALVQRDLLDSMEDLLWIIALDDNSDEEMEWELLEDLLELYEVISIPRYLAPRSHRSRHHGEETLEKLVREGSEHTFLNLFRMQRESFWQLVNLLTPHWDASQSCVTRTRASTGRPSRPIYQQLAVALYMLGAQGGGNKVTLNIGRGTISLYLWRAITVLTNLVSHYIRWPSIQQRAQFANKRMESGETLHQCVGFLDGTIIVFQEKPKINAEAYYSWKKNYGLNLQAVCDWDGRFIYASASHMGSFCDSAAFKASPMHGKQQEYFEPEEYVLADNAYELARHVIVPYRDTQGMNTAFNSQVSVRRAKIELALGKLKARWASLDMLPLRISEEDQRQGHTRVINWIMACIVLQNLLIDLKDDESWLQENMVQPSSGDCEATEAEQDQVGEEAQEGSRRRDSLRDMVLSRTAQAS